MNLIRRDVIFHAEMSVELYFYVSFGNLEPQELISGFGIFLLISAEYFPGKNSQRMSVVRKGPFVGEKISSKNVPLSIEPTPRIASDRWSPTPRPILELSLRATSETLPFGAWRMIHRKRPPDPTPPPRGASFP